MTEPSLPSSPHSRTEHPRRGVQRTELGIMVKTFVVLIALAVQMTALAQSNDENLKSAFNYIFNGRTDDPDSAVAIVDLNECVVVYQDRRSKNTYFFRKLNPDTIRFALKEVADPFGPLHLENGMWRSSTTTVPALTVEGDAAENNITLLIRGDPTRTKNALAGC